MAHSARRAAAWAVARRGDLAGVAFLFVLVFLLLSPALKDGPTFGPADLGRGLSLLTQLPAPPLNHNVLNGDQITQSIPWNTLDWQLVHHGELPLWNPYSGTGMPQLLNFESAAFALPTLVGYLFPLSLSFLVTVAMKLLIAGTGTYVAARLLGCRPLAATLAGATAMLSAGLVGWVGWAVSGPLVWAGWLVAGALLAYRRGRVRDVALLGVTAAFAVYGGFPETDVLLALALGVLGIVSGAVALLVGARLDRRGAARVVAGGVAGAALSAPLWLPGLLVLRGSSRFGLVAAHGLPLNAIVLLLAQGYDGLPLGKSAWFGPGNYYETAGYLGVLAIACACAGLLLVRRRPVVVGLGVTTLFMVALIYAFPGDPLQAAVRGVGLGAVALQRGLALVGFCVALLAGLGAEQIAARGNTAAVRRALLVPGVVLAGLLVWLFLRGGPSVQPPPLGAAPPPSLATLASLRRASLIWPSAGVGALLLAALAAGRLARRRRHARHATRRNAVGARLALGALVAAESATLLFASVGLNSYASTSFPSTAPLRTLERTVGSALVALDAGNVSCALPATPPACGVRRWMGVGIYPETNIGYGLTELAVHDPTIPRAVFSSWPVPNAGQDLGGNLNVFVPNVDTAALARRYGARFVLVGPHGTPPVNMTKVATIPASNGAVAAAMTLWRVPGAARFTFASGQDSVAASTRRGDRTYVLQVDAPRAGTLLAHVTALPGWRATTDGRVLPVRDVDGQLALSVPAGTTAITLSYWPKRFTAGVVAALLALAALGVAGVFGWWARRRKGGARRPVEGRTT